MRRIDLPLPSADPATWIVAELAALGLTFERLELKRYPGCVHWHIRMPGQTGTLEATWWPSTNQFWLEQRAGRTADWQDGVVSFLTKSE